MNELERMEDYEWVYVEDSDLPDYIKNVVETPCKYCGHKVVVNKEKTIMKCVNPQCPRKIAGSIDKMRRKLNIKGWGIEKIKLVVMTRPYRCITDFLLDPPAEYKKELYEYLDGIPNFIEAIKFISIPNFSEDAVKLFSQHRDFQDFYDKWTKSGYSLETYLTTFYGYSKTTTNVLNVLSEYEEDLWNLTNIFNFSNVKELKENITICITGSVRTSKCLSILKCPNTKEGFVNALQRKLQTKGVSLTKKDSVTEDTEYVLTEDINSTNGKANIGRSRGILWTIDEFFMEIYERYFKRES